jgi:hypothetical protein
MALRGRAHDCEPEPGTVAVESLEDPFAVEQVHAFTFVLDTQQRALCVHPDGDRDGSASVPPRVLDEIPQCTLERIAVACDGRALRIDAVRAGGVRKLVEAHVVRRR